MAEIMTTKEVAEYLKLHEITVTKHAKKGTIPSIRIGKVFRFEKGAIDKWFKEGQKK
jgi:excisionase family DNA binding protein